MALERVRTVGAVARRTWARGDVLGDALLVRDVTTVHRVLFLGLASRVGILAALRRGGADRPRLSADLGVDDGALLDAILRLGAAVGELRIDRDGRWQLAGRRARAMVRQGGDAQAAFVQEVVTHDAPGIDAVARRLRGEAVEFDYLRHDPPLIARASRIVEPVLAEVVAGVVRSRGARSVLDVGCGSGVYLRHAVEAAPGVEAVGIDRDPSVIDDARRNLDEWGMAGRATLVHADLFELPSEMLGRYDVVLSLQNVYYAPPDEQPAFVRALHRAARPGGVVVIATVVRADESFGALFDVLLRASPDRCQVPSEEDLLGLLRGAGCHDVEVRSPVPRLPVRVAVGTV